MLRRSTGFFLLGCFENGSLGGALSMADRLRVHLFCFLYDVALTVVLPPWRSVGRIWSTVITSHWVRVERRSSNHFSSSVRVTK